MSNVIFWVTSLLVNVKCIFLVIQMHCLHMHLYTVGYGCLQETSNVGHTPFISFKDVFTLSLIIQEIVATTMEVDREVASK